MKKTILFIAISIFIVFICACLFYTPQTTYTVKMDGIEFTVDTENNTIYDGTNTYRYTLSKFAEGFNAEIIYPNDATYRVEAEWSGFQSGGWSDNYDCTQYVSGSTLINVLEEKEAKRPSTRNYFLIAILLAIGAFNIGCPYIAWYISEGLFYKDLEPSDMGLMWIRISGVVAIIFAIVMLFV